MMIAEASLSLPIVERALRLPDFDIRDAQVKMAPRPRTLYRPDDKPGRPLQGGVLVLLYPLDGRLAFALTRRTDQVDNHRGQISLPGGRQESGETLTVTALRETCEELGICLDEGRILGQLAPLYIPPSDFEIHPFVAYAPARPHFQPAPAEVAELLEVPLARLLEPAVHVEEEWTLHGYQVMVPYYHLSEHKVWGATAIVLSEFEHRLRVALTSTTASDVAREEA